MTAHHLQLVHRSFIQMLPVVDEVMVAFYSRLFELDPHLGPFFTTDMTRQREKFGHMLDTLLGDPERFEAMLPAVRRMGVRHLEYGAREEHYATVSEALMYALQEVLGDAFTAEVHEAWLAVYGKLAEEMMGAARKV